MTHLPGGIAVISLLFLAVACDENVTNSLFQGEIELGNKVKLKGELYWENDQKDHRGFAYYGYKYGKAGRFEDSVLNTNFSYMQDLSHPKQGHVCPQLEKQLPLWVVFHRNLSMDEDCLYLDVYVPPIKKQQEKPWPVMFWIYGGGFFMGDKDMYNGTILAKAADAIVVTINYRVSIFGFLSTGDELARGNWAIGDIKLALDWTRANIASFNGDPKRITIFGESAGGALTSALMLDDKVRSEVFAAVAMSGSMLVPWAITKKPGLIVSSVAETVNCSGETMKDKVDCLKKASVEKLLNAAKAVQRERKALLLFTPVIDGKQIPKEPVEILRERARSPCGGSRGGTFITGHLKEDAAFVLLGVPHFLNSSMDLATIDQLLKPSASVAISADDCARNTGSQMQMIFDYYKVSAANSSDELRQSYYEISTDMMFGLGAVAESVLYSNITGSYNQMYLISFDPAYKNMGAFHFLEVIHLFRGFLDKKMKEKNSDALTESLHEFIRQVAHTGRFNGPSFGREGNFLELDKQAKWVEKSRNFLPLLEFWETVKNLDCPGLDSIPEYNCTSTC